MPRRFSWRTWCRPSTRPCRTPCWGTAGRAPSSLTWSRRRAQIAWGPTGRLYSDDNLTVLYLDPQPYQTVQPLPERNRTPPTDLKLRKMILFTRHLVPCRQRNMRWGRLLTDKKFPQRFRSCPATATSPLMSTVISQHLVRALQVSASKFLKSRNLPASVQHWKDRRNHSMWWPVFHPCQGPTRPAALIWEKIPDPTPSASQLTLQKNQRPSPTLFLNLQQPIRLSAAQTWGKCQ